MLNCNVLLVDDDKLILKAFASRLRKRGLNIFTLDSGVHVFETVEKENIDIILLDIVMPEITGFDVLDQIRGKYDKLEMPIIMLTGKSGESDVISALDKGANDYIAKPASVDVALARITTQMELVKLSIESAKAREVAAASAMIATYNHEFNNPLCIAISYLELYEKKKEQKHLDGVRDSLIRIQDIVKKISKITDGSLVFQDYAKSGDKGILKV